MAASPAIELRTFVRNSRSCRWTRSVSRSATPRSNAGRAGAGWLTTQPRGVRPSEAAALAGEGGLGGWPSIKRVAGAGGTAVTLPRFAKSL